MVAAYRDASTWVQALAVSSLSKPDRIRKIIKSAFGKITKAEILEQCPGIRKITVQRTLVDLQESEEILKLIGGRYTVYIWNREKSS